MPWTGITFDKIPLFIKSVVLTAFFSFTSFILLQIWTLHLLGVVLVEISKNYHEISQTKNILSERCSEVASSVFEFLILCYANIFLDVVIILKLIFLVWNNFPYY